VPHIKQENDPLFCITILCSVFFLAIPDFMHKRIIKDETLSWKELKNCFIRRLLQTLFPKYMLPS
jgi:hypothetical protein